MNEQIKTENRASRPFWRGSGLYVMLAVCVAMVGGLAVLGVKESLKTPSGMTTTPTTTITTRSVAAAGRATSVRDARTTTTTQTTAVAADSPMDTLCVLPLSNAVVQSYSEKPVYWDTLDSWRVHLGTDFAGKEGDTVKAASDGTVKTVFHDALWGDCITIDHGAGQTSTYCGVTAACAPGDTVKAGKAIGTLSDIPCESRLGPHLHFEWSVSGEAVDPLTVLQGEIRYVDPPEASAQS